MDSRSSRERSPRWYLIPVRVVLVTLVVTSLTFAVCLFLGIAGLLAGVSAILLGPTSPVLATIFGAGSAGFANNSGLLLRGLGAAMIGGLTSLPQVFAAGIGIGVIESLVRWNYPTGGATDMVLVAVILGSLLLRKDLRQLARGGTLARVLAGAIGALASAAPSSRISASPILTVRLSG